MSTTHHIERAVTARSIRYRGGHGVRGQSNGHTSGLRRAAVRNQEPAGSGRRRHRRQSRDGAGRREAGSGEIAWADVELEEHGDDAVDEVREALVEAWKDGCRVRRLNELRAREGGVAEERRRAVVLGGVAADPGRVHLRASAEAECAPWGNRYSPRRGESCERERRSVPCAAWGGLVELLLSNASGARLGWALCAEKIVRQHFVGGSRRAQCRRRTSPGCPPGPGTGS